MTDFFPKIVIDEKVNANDKIAVEYYVDNIRAKKVAVILSERHLSLLVGVELDILYAISNAPDNFYRTFRIRKHSGGHRIISAPLPLLLRVQQWILRHILESIPTHAAAKAYKKKCSIKDNAKFHRSQPYVFKTDVENFFDSIKSFWIFCFFREIGYTASVSRLLAGICCKEDSLPQGAATSGYLSNIYLNEFDSVVFNYCREHELRYTRYADDITISGPRVNFEEIFNFIKMNLNECHLRINFKKTKLIGKSAQQKVTGIVVNQKLSVERSFLREIRQEMHYIKKYGIYGHCRHIGKKSAISCVNKIIGKLSFIRFVIGRNKIYDEHRDYLYKILSELE